MRNLKFLFGFLLALLTLFTGEDYAQLGKQHQQQLGNRTIHLFNRKNLDGWYRFLQKSGREHDPQQVFSVSNGLLRIGGEEWGCITTLNEYENYKLILEFKWGGKTYSPRLGNARDCGVLLHSKGRDGSSQGIWIHSIECQIIEGGTGDFIVVGDSTNAFQLTTTVAKAKTDDSYVYLPGGDTLKLTSDRINWFGRSANWKDTIGFRGADDIERPFGEWNRMECIAQGDKISIRLNGVIVNKAFNVKPSRGKIQLQAEGAEIFFRRVDLEPLSATGH